MLFNREGRAERLFARAVKRFRVSSTYVERSDGCRIPVTAYRSTPDEAEESDLTRRLAYRYEWRVSRGDFEKLRRFLGDSLFSGAKIIDADGGEYVIDKLSPFTPMALNGGYKIFTAKVLE